MHAVQINIALSNIVGNGMGLFDPKKPKQCTTIKARCDKSTITIYNFYCIRYKSIHNVQDSIIFALGKVIPTYKDKQNFKHHS